MPSHHPDLGSLADALPGLTPYLDAVAMATTEAADGLNAEGGDPTVHGAPRLLARHLGHYLAAADVALAHSGRVDGVLDVGCGSGAFSGWLAGRLGVPLSLADHDPAVLAAALAATGAVAAVTELDDAALAPLVTAMEVLEHIPPTAQAGFAVALVRRVRPGGLLVLSTPDESLYPGGWSGYAPHVGCVTAGQLADLLSAAVDATASVAAEVEVWRIVGGPYDTSAGRRMLESVGNRVWTAVGQLAPSVPAVLERRGRAVRSQPDLTTVTGLQDVRVVPATEGRGGSLLAVVRVRG